MADHASAHRLTSTLPRVDVTENVAARIMRALGDHRERTFLEHAGGRMTRGEFLDAVARRQERLIAHGVARNSKALVFSGRGTDFWIDLVALWGLGATAVPVDRKIEERRFGTMTAKAEPHAALGSPKSLRAALAGISVVEDDGSATSDGADAPVTVCDGLARQPAAVLFTSGSTGDPKGVVLSHDALAGNSLAILRVLDLQTEDRLFISIPFHFTSAINHFLAVALTGAALVGNEQSMLPADLARAVTASGATCFGGAPLQLRWIAECADDAASRLRWVMSSGDHLGADVIGLLQQALPDVAIYTIYGLTEVGGRFCVLPPEFTRAHAGSVGSPIPGLDIWIGDEDGRPAPAGEIGEIYAAGCYLFDGYIRDDATNARVLSAAGFKTGDLGRIDENGLLWVHGRTDDVFKCSGQKVSTLPIHEALMTTGHFADVAVVPVDDPMLGKVPSVYYVLNAGIEFRKGEVMRALRHALPSNHLPRSFQEVASIPRTGSGKLDRVRVRSLAEAPKSPDGSGP